MGIEDLVRYRDFGKSLEENDRKNNGHSPMGGQAKSNNNGKSNNWV